MNMDDQRIFTKDTREKVHRERSGRVLSLETSVLVELVYTTLPDVFTKPEVS
jgi:hypothetical protein